MRTCTLYTSELSVCVKNVIVTVLITLLYRVTTPNTDRDKLCSAEISAVIKAERPSLTNTYVLSYVCIIFRAIALPHKLRALGICPYAACSQGVLLLPFAHKLYGPAGSRVH